MRASVTCTVLCMILAATMLTPASAAGPMAHGAGPMAHGSNGFHPVSPHIRIVHRRPNEFLRGNVVPRLQSFSPYGYYPYGYFGDDGFYDQAATTAAPDVTVAEPQSVAAPVAVAHYEPPTVETTPEGVTVVRGPGSHRPAP